MKPVERTFLLVIVGLAVVEFVLNSFYEIGFLVYAIFVGVILLLMENEIGHTKEEQALIFLMIIPICRLAELFLNFNVFWNTLIFYILVIGLTMFYAIKFWFRIRKNPFVGNPIYFLIVLFAAGAGALVAKYAFHAGFAGIIFLIPIIAYAEEIYFRGSVQRLTNEWFGNFSILITSFLYAIFGISYGFVFVLIAFFASLVISTLYHFTKNLYVSFVLNMVFHVLLFIFYPVVFS
jgi:membrane protease YdiL (CAAX protease family)